MQIYSPSFLFFRRFVFYRFEEARTAVALFGGFFAVLTFLTISAFAQDATKNPEPKPLADLEALTTFPENATKNEIIKFQERLRNAVADAAPQDALKFLDLTADAFYRSTKALLACELDAAERAQYSSQFAQILATRALQEGVATQQLGPKFDELNAFVETARQSFEAQPTDETRHFYITLANYSFFVRYRFAENWPQNLPQKTRDDVFSTLASDMIEFALTNPEYGPTAFELVLSIRAFSKTVGDAALETLCVEFEESKNPQLTQLIPRLLGRRRFLQLPGGELRFEGLLLKDGEFKEAFDFENYRGKVVLVEFWAAWCEPCRRELPQLKELYEKYRSQGFEIIGYSIDQDVEQLKSFVVENALPWATVSQTASIEAGYVGLYDFYALEGIPELILIGRDGKVIQTDARGPKLVEALAKLFPEKKPTPESAQKSDSSKE